MSCLHQRSETGLSLEDWLLEDRKKPLVENSRDSNKLEHVSINLSNAHYHLTPMVLGAIGFVRLLPMFSMGAGGSICRELFGLACCGAEGSYRVYLCAQGGSSEK